MSRESFPSEEECTAGRRPVVLVVDDEIDIRQMVSAGLRCDGYRVIEAVDGADALDRLAPAMLLKCNVRAPDLIITDVRMPDIDGLTLLKGLRARGWATPIILITAYDNPTLEKRAIWLRADAVFKKPFDLDALRAAVMNILWPARVLADD